MFYPEPAARPERLSFLREAMPSKKIIAEGGNSCHKNYSRAIHRLQKLPKNFLFNFRLLLFGFFQFFFEAVELFETLQEDKDAEDHQDYAYTLTDAIGHTLVQLIVELLGQNDFRKINQKIRTDHNADVEDKILDFGISIAHGNHGDEPEKHHTNVQKVQQKTVKISFKIVLTDEFFLALDVHFGLGNQHVQGINKNQEG